VGFKISKLQYDPEKEKGIWVNQYGEAVEGDGNPDDLELLIAPMGSLEYDRAQSSQLRRNKRMQREAIDGTLDLVKVESVTVNALAESCLLGWRHMVDDDGNEIPYSKETARELLVSHRPFFVMVRELSQAEALFRRDELEQAEKNCATLSAGPSSGESTPNS
jgi:hypothetical protein